MTACPVSLCGAALRRGHLMCRPCWSRVPRALQSSVNRTWAAYRRELKPGNVEARQEARRSYLNATQAAIDAVEASRP